MKEIIIELLSYMGKTYDDIVKKSHQPDDVVPRQICAYVLRNITTCTLSYIGYHLRMNDHTIVSYSISRVKEMKDTKDPIFIKYYDALPSRYKSFSKISLSNETKNTLRIPLITNPAIKYRA